MSVLPSTTANCMASAVRSPAPERETFQNFFECWLVEQNQHLQELIAASQQHHSTADDDSLCFLIKRVLEHYEHYYKAKARWGKEDVLAMLSPSWTSTFEDAFLWIGGWRPIMAFHLLYFKSGLQLEDQLNELIRGMGRGDLGDLSPCQLSRIDELQAKTIKEEKEVTEKMAKHQETVADSSMLELNHLVSGNDEERGWGRCGSGEGESAMECKEEGLKEMLQRADDLRLRTLKAVIDILTPIQAVHFLIAAAPKDS
ncbi:Transcription factor TGA like domain - like 1 [Theobroma cacao]|nr:Transcription factor TGA like domain - like 1 [Theobroma cacao]